MRGDRSTTLRRVADLMRAAILTGAMPHLLPSEHELQVTYATSRNVIRDALALLRDEGLIERQQGSGTSVVGRRFQHRVDRIGGFDPTGAGVGVRRESLSLAIVPAAPVVVAELRLDDGADCVMIERLTVTDGGTFGEDEPTSLWTSYLPLEFTDVMTELTRFDSLHDVIARVSGSEIEEVRFTVNAGLASVPVAESIRVQVGAPVIRQQRIAVLTDGRVCEFALGWSRGDRLTLNSVRRA